MVGGRGDLSSGWGSVILEGKNPWQKKWKKSERSQKGMGVQKKQKKNVRKGECHGIGKS